MICFTRRGAQLGKKLKEQFNRDGISCTCYGKSSRLKEAAENGELILAEEPLDEWTGKQFGQADGLIFIGAVGIAVRSSARWIRDKCLDPALVVVDEKGTYAIPVLSGHMGGANALAEKIGRYLGALPVITTATDVEGRFAVDLFAREHKLLITDRRLAKEISAELLDGKPVGFFSDIPMEDTGAVSCLKNQECRYNIRITVFDEGEKRKPGEGKPEYLFLVPKRVVLGIGCRKGIGPASLKEAVFCCLKKRGISLKSVCRVATVSQKKEEEALKELCEEMGWEFCWFSAEELKTAEGEFSHSDFVEQTVGVGNVCERAAVLGAERLYPGKSRLILKKQQGNGITVAAALAGAFCQAPLPAELP